MKFKSGDTNILIQKLYLFFIILCSNIYYFITIYRLFTLRNEIIQQFLIISFAIDTLFVLFFLRIIKFTKFEILIFFLFVPSVLVGVFSSEPGRRWLTDLLIPILFLMKICICKAFFRIEKYKSWIIKLFKGHAKLTLFFVILGTSAHFLISYYFDMQTYSGLEPPVYSILIFNILKNNFLGIISTILIVLYSGKRAILISILFIIALTILFNKLKIKKVISVTFISVCIIFFSFLFFDKIEKLPAFEKYFNTFALLKEGNNEDLDQSGGGRINEINSITNQMDFHNYLVGKGIGFTYKVGKENEVVEVANAHFTPIGIISKYGLIFYFPFMFYYFFLLFVGYKKLKSFNFGIQFSFYYMFAMIIDSMFSYSIFINPLLPFCMGYISSFASIKV